MTENALCNFFIRILNWWAHRSGFGYGEINVLLFLILQPLLILLFMITTVWGCRTASGRMKTALQIFTAVMFAICAAGTIVILIIPWNDGMR